MQIISQKIAEWIMLIVGSEEAVLPAILIEKSLRTLLVIIALWVIRKAVLRLVHQRIKTPSALFTWRKGSDYTALILGSIWLWQIWFSANESNNFAQYLGIVSAGIAIALQAPLVNLAGWIFILVRRPFEVGDRIEINGEVGDVVDTHLFQFTLLELKNWVGAEQSTGRVKHIPNKYIFEHPVANYNKGFPLIWNELPVEVTFESDWRKAKELLQAIAIEHVSDVSEKSQKQIRNSARRYGIHFANLTPTVYTKVEASGIKLTIRFLCEVRQRRGTEQVLWEAILDAFAERDDMDFAYPTQRIYYLPAEG